MTASHSSRCSELKLWPSCLPLSLSHLPQSFFCSFHISLSSLCLHHSLFKATVLFVDTGKSQMVSCQHLCSLPSSLSLTSVPPLAIPCRLHGVHSTFSAGEWYFLDNQLLWKHLMKKKVNHDTEIKYRTCINTTYTMYMYCIVGCNRLYRYSQCMECYGCLAL